MLKVATWSDTRGLIPVQPKYIQLRSPASYDTNKTYIVTTVLQEPYMMQKPSEYGQKEELYGFCKDLADLISKKLGIKCELVISF